MISHGNGLAKSGNLIGRGKSYRKFRILNIGNITTYFAMSFFVKTCHCCVVLVMNVQNVWNDDKRKLKFD